MVQSYASQINIGMNLTPFPQDVIAILSIYIVAILVNIASLFVINMYSFFISKTMLLNMPSQ